MSKTLKPGDLGKKLAEIVKYVQKLNDELGSYGVKIHLDIDVKLKPESE